MRGPSSTTTRWVAASATPLAILAASAMIWQTSQAAFSGKTRNSGNQWSTGTVALTDDDAGGARFQVAGMVPGQTDTKCIKVTANATTPGVVKGYVVNPVTSAQHLEDRIRIVLKAGTGGSFANCAGFVAEETIIPGATLAQLAAYNTYEAGVGGWAVGVGTETRTYEVTYTFDTTGMTQGEIDALQGAQTGIDIQWELRSS